MEVVAMMTETQQYLEKIQALAESALAEAASRPIPSSRKTSLSTTATTATYNGHPFMSSNELSQESNRDPIEGEQQETTRDESRHQDQDQDQDQDQNQTSSNQPSSTEMADTKLSRFYHVMGSSESSAAERREQEERARREAEERARRNNEGK